MASNTYIISNTDSLSTNSDNETIYLDEFTNNKDDQCLDTNINVSDVNLESQFKDENNNSICCYYCNKTPEELDQDITSFIPLDSLFDLSQHYNSDGKLSKFI